MSEGRDRQPISTRCDKKVWAEARAAARGMMGVDPTYSLADLVEAALRREVQRLREEYNDGEPWPSTNGPLRPGRRVAD